MGIVSVGHRLTILKSVYDVKKAQDVPMESDHYLPLCAFPSQPKHPPPPHPHIDLLFSCARARQHGLHR